MPMPQQGECQQQNVRMHEAAECKCARSSGKSVVRTALRLHHVIRVHTLCSVVYESWGESVGNPRLAEC
jgi:hypothetical protein